MRMTRRTFLRATGGAAALATGVRATPAHAQKKQVVTIAFPETVTSMDPHPAPRNSPRESMYEAVFDRFLQQDRQGKYRPAHHRELAVDRRQDGDGHQGPPGREVPRRVGSHRRGRRLQHEPAEGGLDLQGDLREGQGVPGPGQGHPPARLRAVRPLVPPLARLPGRLRDPQGVLHSRSARTTRRAPRSSRGSRSARGRTAWSSFTPGSTLVLEAFDRYWKGAPPIKRAVFKMVTDPTARVAEILSGSADITSEVPVEEFGRLSAQPDTQGGEAARRGHGADLRQPPVRAVQEGGGAPGGPPRDRQEDDRREGAARVRRAVVAHGGRRSTTRTTRASASPTIRRRRGSSSRRRDTRRLTRCASRP